MRPEAPRLLLLALLLMVSGAASARWYQVEVIVFEHTGAMGTGNEQWPPLESWPDFASAMELITALPEMSDEPGADAGSTSAMAFRPLPRQERRLAEVERRLRNSAEYEPLLSAAWRQPSFGTAGAKRIYLADVAGARQIMQSPTLGALPAGAARLGPQPRVQGTVTVRIARLLHVDVDFVYDAAGVPVRLTATRNMKLREIHYFDHPLFGIIVQVSPYVVPGTEAEPAAADEPEDPATTP